MSKALNTKALFHKVIVLQLISIIDLDNHPNQQSLEICLIKQNLTLNMVHFLKVKRIIFKNFNNNWQIKQIRLQYWKNKLLTSNKQVILEEVPCPNSKQFNKKNNTLIHLLFWRYFMSNFRIYDFMYNTLSKKTKKLRK